MLEFVYIYLMRYSLQATSCYIATGTEGTWTAKNAINLQQQHVPQGIKMVQCTKSITHC